MKKRTFALLLISALLLSLLCACGKTELQTIPLGTSGFAVQADAAYKTGTITDDDTSEGQVAYYYSEQSLLDFDIYQWALAAGETLELTAQAEAAEYGATAEKKTFGSIPVYVYTAKEESEGKSYDTASYLMESGGTVAEIVFWLDGKNAAAKAEEIMKTLTLTVQAAKTGAIRLGTSSLYVTPAKAYQAGEISAEDTDENQVGYFRSDETTVDFDVYMWAKAEGETLSAAAAAEAAEYGAEAQETAYNGIKVAYYYAEEESDGETYQTVTYIAEDGDFFVELVIWLDGETANEEAAQIIGSLGR